MLSDAILSEISKQFDCSKDEIKITKRLKGTSSAETYQLRICTEKINVIFKNQTTLNEWLFYKEITPNYEVPAPKTLAISKTSDVLWIIIEKVTKGLHPKKWKKEDIKNALKAIACFHSKFYNKVEQERFKEFPKLTIKEWRHKKKELYENLNKAKLVAKNYEDVIPITIEEIERVKKEISKTKYIDSLQRSGITLLHGDSWIYNFMLTKNDLHIIDWQDCFFGPSALEILHFYDLLPFKIDGMKVGLREIPITLNEIIDIYLRELSKNKIKIKKSDFKESMKAAIFFQLAHYWAPRLKPFTVYLKGGSYFIGRTLRLLPSRSKLRAHFKELLDYTK